MAVNLLVRVSDRLRRTLGMGGDFKRGEIKNDALFEALVRYSADPSVRTILEIGSSTGDGSTQAFVQGIARNPSHPRLFCIEVLKDRFAELQKRVGSLPNVKCYNVGSIPIDKIASETLVRDFLRMNDLKGPVETVLSWRTGELDYVRANNIADSGIATIKRENQITDFDLVLIDGSEFTGHAELDEVYGSRIIALDDVKVMKNHYNLQRLLYDRSYELVEGETRLRNGYAIFQRRQPR